MAALGWVVERTAVAVAAGALALTAGAAHADGMPSVPPTPIGLVADWSGFYIGGKLGGAWSDVSWEQDPNYFTTLGPAVVGTASSFSPRGVAGGVIGGANVQFGQWIIGAELSFFGTDLSQTKPSPFFPAIDRFATQLDWLATVEGRVGYAWDRLLVFGKGGWAGGNASLSLTDAGAGVVASGDTFANGWTIGGGIEYAYWPSFIVGLEYGTLSSISASRTLGCTFADRYCYR